MTSPLWPRSFTAESLSVLRVCAYQYQRRHMEGVPERIFSGLGRGPGELNRAQVGEIIHRCLELFDFAAGANLPRLLKTAADSLGLPPPAPDQGAEILEMLERLHRSPLAELLATAEWRRHEVPFVCQVGAQGDRGTAAGPPPPGAVGAELVSAPNWEHTRCSPTGVPPPEIRIRGQVDCILETKGGEFVLLDYKTHDVEESSIAAVFPQHEFQMQIYAYGLRQARGREQRARSTAH